MFPKLLWPMDPRQWFVAIALCLTVSGCTSIPEYIHNGFKVGPNYRKPPAPVADEWIDSRHKGVDVSTKDLAGWWHALPARFTNSCQPARQ